MAADAPALAEVFLAARRAMAYLPRLHTEAETRDWMAEVVVPGRTVAVVTDGSGMVLGFCALLGRRLEHLYVAPASQGHGHGCALVAWAQAASPAGLDLWVFARNTRAVAFYQRHGFGVVRHTDGAGNEEHEPDVLMAWSSPAAP